MNNSELINTLLTVVILPFLAVLTKYAVTYFKVKTDQLQSKIQNDKLNGYIDKAEDAVATAVTAVSQTFVDSLKKSGTFDEASAKEAFGKAKDKALLLISQDAKDALKDVYGDLDAWLDNKIEYYVKANAGSGILLSGVSSISN